MVILLENWQIFKEYVERWPLAEIMYTTNEADEATIRIRVVAGRYVVDLTPLKDGALLIEVLEFLRQRDAERTLAVVRNIETFFL